MKFLLTAVALTLSCVAGDAFAQSATAPKEMAKEMTSKATSDSGEESCCASKEECDGECPISKAMASLPAMSYQVGSEKTCCSESAAKLAEASNEAIHFVVAEKVYQDKTEAMTALVEKTEAMVEEFITPCKCETSGKTTIAGETCSCPVQGEQNVALVKAAVEAVNVSYKVGDESCNCPMKAKELAANSDSEMTYVVNGEETCCSMTARLQTARAKYKAAVEAMVSASSKAAAGEESNS